MFIRFRFPLAATALVCLAGAFNANATTIDFSTALSLGHQGQSVTVGGVTASAWFVSKTNGASWSLDGVILNNRKEGSSELGLGVCLATDCPTPGNGNKNEIDNNGSVHFDVIRLGFSLPTLVSSIGLSSLDSGLKDGFAIFGSNSALPDLSQLTALAQGTNTSVGVVTPIVPINKTFQYFFVTSKNRGVNDTGSDFLLESVTTTPEPYTSAMLGFGLLAIGTALRRKTRRQA